MGQERKQIRKLKSELFEFYSACNGTFKIKNDIMCFLYLKDHSDISMENRQQMNKCVGDKSRQGITENQKEKIMAWGKKATGEMECYRFTNV